MNLLAGIKDYLLLNKNMYRLNASELRAYQQQALANLLEYATANSPFYRELYQDAPSPYLEHFTNLPTINKQIMMDHFSTLNTCQLNIDEVMTYALNNELNHAYEGYFHDEFVVGLSSGTSGNKGVYITPKALTERLPFVFLARSGIPLKLLPFRILFLLRVFSQGFADINAPFINLKYASTMTPIPALLEQINTNRINILMAPPSLLRLLLPYVDQIKVAIKLIVCYAEVLEVEEKRRLEKFFGAQVIEIYQASEGQIGSTCKHGNLHINEDLVFIELYDAHDQPLTAPHQLGTKMLLTNLVNYAQPLIRYEMNDMIILGDKCSCGSSFRVIERIVGRNDDVLFFRNSRNQIQHVFPDLFSRWIITTSDGIREFQVQQHPNTDTDIMIDLFENYRSVAEEIHTQLLHRIQQELANFMIDNPKINIVFTEIALPKDKNKYKRFIKLP